MDKTNVAFLLSGDKFKKDQTSLHDLLQAYDAFEGIIDSTYSVAVGISRFSDHERKNYQIVIRETKDNSWDSFFDLIIAVSPVLFGNPVSPTDVLSTAKATFNFLKCVFTLKDKGEPYSINNNANGSISVHTENGNTYNFYAPISINIGANAKEMLPEVSKILELMDRGSLDTIQINTDKEQILSLNRDEARVFKLEEKPSDVTHDFDGEIYRYNKRSRTGKLQVRELQEIPQGVYTFRVFDPKIQDDVIISMIKVLTTITVRPIVIIDPITNEEIIQYLEVIDV